MNKNNLKLIISVNVAITIVFILLHIRGYYAYKAMAGALNTNSFLYMSALEVCVLSGLVIMLTGKKFGFYIYLISQIACIIYPFVTGVVDTVFGLLILPAIGFPVAFTIYYVKNLGRLQT